MPKVECRTCQTTMPLPVLYMHVKSCGDTQSADDDEDEGQCPICLEIFTHRQLLIHASICGDSADDALKLLASRVDDSKDFKICVSRTDFFQRAMVQWQRQKKGTPGNTLRVTFWGEAGAIRKEFLTDLIGEIEKRLFEHQGHQSGKSPIYSLSDLEKGYFRLAIFKNVLVILPVVFTCYLCFNRTDLCVCLCFLFQDCRSLAQGGPAPCFLRQWCFDYLSAGDLDEANLTKDDVDDAELFELIQKVEEETDLSAWTNDIITCGYTGLIKPDNKEAIIRSIVLHATLRLIPLLKQLRKGLQVYNFVDILQDHCGLCQHFFIPTAADDDNEADADCIMQSILPQLSEKGTMREARETAIVNFLQDFLQETESADDIPDGDTLPLTVHVQGIEYCYMLLHVLIVTLTPE
ncbi:hypothetical protein G5714_022105 [Onychostoma macrolepis]|uniref:HECT domain-containing protein n=1 Tax=Onychostoma macrolepis TaxID=369639 RepID=A0A7J6BSX6_9TELE|nr:hypothetical protein G5714_022105 [Onychostoma macrolepis]